jgi:hypothetical protein
VEVGRAPRQGQSWSRYNGWSFNVRLFLPIDFPTVVHFIDMMFFFSFYQRTNDLVKNKSMRPLLYVATG